MNLEVVLEWTDTTRSVLIHLEPWVRVTIGAMKSIGRFWWDSTRTTFLEGRAHEQITWDEFIEVFYSQYFSSTIKVKKKMDFLSLRQQESMPTVEYQFRFLLLERFVSGSVSSYLPNLYQDYASICV